MYSHTMRFTRAQRTRAFGRELASTKLDGGDMTPVIDTFIGGAHETIVIATDAFAVFAMRRSNSRLRSASKVIRVTWYRAKGLPYIQ